MSKKKKSNSNNKSLIKENSTPKTIAIQKIIEDDYPLFCFRYLSDKSIKSCNKADFFIDFLIRLHKLSELGWEEIRKSGRHGFGMEPLHKSKIIPKLPECVSITNIIHFCVLHKYFAGISHSDRKTARRWKESLGYSEAFFLPLCGFSIFEQVDQFDYCFHKFPKKDLVRFKALQYVGDCEV